MNSKAFQSKRVLITGGGGFIGSAMAHRMVRYGARVTVIDGKIPGCGFNAANLKEIESNIEFLDIDLAEPNAGLVDLVQNKDYIFNIAGKVSHQESMRDPLADQRSNSTAHLLLMKALKQANHKGVTVYASTRQIYGHPQFVPVTEEHPITPVDINGIHKFAGESYHSLYSRTYGLKTLSLRLTNTFGPRQCITNKELGFMGWFVRNALVGEEFELYGGGRELRDFHYVEDCLNAFELAALEPKCFGKAFNLSGPRATVRDIAEILIRIMGRGKTREIEFPVERAKIAIGDYYGSSEAFHELTGWSAKVELEAGLQQTLDFYSKHRGDYLPEGRA